MKKSVLSISKEILCIIVVLLFCVTVSGCQREGTMESAGEKVDESIDEVNDAINSVEKKTAEVIGSTRRD